MNNFTPTGAGTVNLVVGAASTNVGVVVPNASVALRIANVGTQVVFLRFGFTNAVAATVAADFPLLPNTAEMFEFGGPLLFVAGIATAVGSTVYITPGMGS